MIIYLFFFAICFIIDSVQNKTLNKILKILLFSFLCFGYMTGSDWRVYEIDYNNQDFGLALANGEVGYVYICLLFSKIIKDFWLFAGLMKIFHLYSLVLLFRCFIKKPYYAVGISFAGSLLFMLIDCPMRFMMAMSFIYLAIIFSLNNSSKKIIFRLLPVVLLCVVAALIHAITIPIILFLLTIPLSKYFAKVNRFVLLIFYSAVFFIASASGVFERLFSDIVPFLYEDRFTVYEDYQNTGLLTIGVVKNFVYLLIILYNRDIIIEKKYGAIVYYLSFFSIFFQPIFNCVPTMFRLNILNGFFLSIALAIIIIDKVRKTAAVKVCKWLIILSSIIVLSRECITNEHYTPYSNSIPYIITGNHLPYGYRDSYNYNHHTGGIF